MASPSGSASAGCCPSLWNCRRSRPTQEGEEPKREEGKLQISSYALDYFSRSFTRSDQSAGRPINWVPIPFFMLLPASGEIQHTSARLARLRHAQQDLEQKQPAL